MLRSLTRHLQARRNCDRAIAPHARAGAQWEVTVQTSRAIGQTWWQDFRHVLCLYETRRLILPCTKPSMYGKGPR